MELLDIDLKNKMLIEMANHWSKHENYILALKDRCNTYFEQYYMVSQSFFDSPFAKGYKPTLCYLTETDEHFGSIVVEYSDGHVENRRFKIEFSPAWYSVSVAEDGYAQFKQVFMTCHEETVNKIYKIASQNSQKQA